MATHQNFAIGLAVWGHRNWLGDLFPAKTRSTDFLKCYGQRFSIVEGNTTFYSIPSPETVARWREETPPGFQFFSKFPQSITHANSHQGRLMPSLPQAFQFLDLMQGLGDRLGGLFLQLPPSYSPAQWPDLELFLSSWRSATALPLFLEVRHAQWFTKPHCDRLNDHLRHCHIDRAILDTRPIYDASDNPQQYSVNKKPQVPMHPIVTANTAFIRYISHPIRDQNLPYLSTWVHQIQQWLHQGHNIYFFIHCPLEDHSPTNALYLQDLLDRSNIPVPPLPWQLLPTATTNQLTLKFD